MGEIGIRACSCISLSSLAPSALPLNAELGRLKDETYSSLILPQSRCPIGTVRSKTWTRSSWRTRCAPPASTRSGRRRGAAEGEHHKHRLECGGPAIFLFAHCFKIKECQGGEWLKTK